MKRERRYITINEAAEICGVHRRTIYNWIEQGFLGDIVRTPSGNPRIDKLVLLIKAKHRRQPYKENLPNGIQ